MYVLVSWEIHFYLFLFLKPIIFLSYKIVEYLELELV